MRVRFAIAALATTAPPSASATSSGWLTVEASTPASLTKLLLLQRWNPASAAERRAELLQGVGDQPVVRPGSAA